MSTPNEPTPPERHDDVDQHGIPDERTLPSVNRSRAGQSRAMQYIMVGACLLAGAGMIYLYLPKHPQASATNTASNPKKTKSAVNSSVPNLDLAALERRAEQLRAAQAHQHPAPAPVSVHTAPAPIDKAAVARAKAAADLAARRQRSPLIAYGSKTSRPANNNSPATAAAPNNQLAAYTAMLNRVNGSAAPPGSVLLGGQQQNSESLASKLNVTQLQATSAATLGNRDMLLTEGTFLDCTLQTALISTVPGFSECVLSRNIYSNSGRVILLPRGTKLTGEYSGGIKQGENRIFAVWTRAETPDGVIISLNSPGTDALGAAGLPGMVDTHFWQRFSGALLVSVVNDAFSVLASSQGSGVQSLSNTSGTVKDSASIALQNSINIPPTLYKNQGDKINIIVARDLDFSSVYSLQLTRVSSAR